MKVLHLLSSSSFSGAENVVCQICKMFENTDIEMIYCSPRGTIENALNKNNIEYIPIDKMSPIELRKVVKKCNPNIIQAHDHTAGVIAAFSFLNIPVINHLHNNAEWMKSFNIKTLIYTVSCFKYKEILTVSNSVMEEFLVGNIFKNKTVVVNNPFDSESIVEMSKREGIEDASDVMYLGRLVDEKNPRLFIESVTKVIDKFPKLQVAIVGDGYLKDDLLEKVYNLKLDENIHFYGFQNNPYGLLKNTKLLCVTSKWEGFGLVAAEALALGKPVLATSVGGLTSIVNESCGAFCNSSDEFAKHIISFMNDKVLYDKSSSNALIRSNELSNYKDYKSKLLDIYMNL